jgi:hypothetical protein
MSKYLYLYGYGQFLLSDGEPTASDLEDVDNGVLDIIDISVEDPRYYLEGEWHDMDKVN